MSDLIRREDAIDAMIILGIKRAISILETLPSAEPERTAKVKRLEKRSETSMSWEGICTHCGAYTMIEMNYCFLCGAKLDWSRQ